MIEFLKDSFGSDIVLITNEDGSTSSMLKSTYDEMIANEAASL